MLPSDRLPPVKMESRDERVTVRFTPSHREMLEVHARARGEELSRYIRRCTLIGDSMDQNLGLLQATQA